MLSGRLTVWLVRSQEKPMKGGDEAEGDVFFGFPWDAQIVGYGVDVHHAVCELFVLMGSVCGVRT